ncbi:MAG TPA: hypothetical protein VMM76_24550 [Pirellulaceae bacterium]|nr:hypothetical protein [Pirellulaceae bacterium]
MLQVVEIDAIEHLEALRLRWTSLLYDTPGASFFHTLDWLKVYWQHFRRDQRLRVLVVHRSGTVLGVLPLVVRKEMTSTGLVDVLAYPTISPSQFLGPIGPNPTATLMASFRHLSSGSRNWDVLSLGEIGEHDRGRTANALELAGFVPLETVRSKVAKVSLGTSSYDHETERPWKFAERQDENEASLPGCLTFERIRSLGDADGEGSIWEEHWHGQWHPNRSLGDADGDGSIREEHWHGQWHPNRPLGGADGDGGRVDEIVAACCALTPGSLACEQPATLLCQVAAVASRLGMLDLNLLWLDGRLMAFSFNVHFDGIIQQISAGEAAASFDFDPATVLSLRMVQDSIRRRDRCLYFAAMNDGFANFLAAEELSVVRYQHCAAPPLRDCLTQFGRWLKSPGTKV